MQKAVEKTSKFGSWTAVSTACLRSCSLSEVHPESLGRCVFWVAQGVLKDCLRSLLILGQKALHAVHNTCQQSWQLSLQPSASNCHAIAGTWSFSPRVQWHSDCTSAQSKAKDSGRLWATRRQHPTKAQQSPARSKDGVACSGACQALARILSMPVERLV